MQRNQAKYTSGFTLIELMIVVAIIGILAAIALPAYSNFQARAKVTAGLAEINGGKTAFEFVRNEGTTISNPSDVGLSDTGTSNCEITVSNTDISCKIINAPSQVINKTIILSRPSIDDIWRCDASAFDPKFKPNGCS